MENEATLVIPAFRGIIKQVDDQNLLEYVLEAFGFSFLKWREEAKLWTCAITEENLRIAFPIIKMLFRWDLHPAPIELYVFKQ